MNVKTHIKTLTTHSPLYVCIFTQKVYKQFKSLRLHKLKMILECKKKGYIDHTGSKEFVLLN